MKTIIQSSLLLLALLLPATIAAHDFEVDGIYYVINGNEAAVSFRGSSFIEYSEEYSGSVIIPASVTYNGTTYQVTSIGDYAFYRCTGMTSVSIPNTVTSIGSRSFTECKGLTSVNIPNSVTSVGSYAFFECSLLESVSISNSLTTISSYMFAYCPELKSITIPSSVTTISYYAFQSCSGLETLTIPASVTGIYNYAFASCSQLTSITVAEDNPKYDSRDNCNAIIEKATNTLNTGCKNTVIPNTVTKIGTAAFYQCSELTSITIPNSVTNIGPWSFFNCTALTSVTIPNSVTVIDNNAFYRCPELASVTIPNSVTTIGNNAFAECTVLASLTIPSSVISIGNTAFSSCPGLTSIVVENNNPKYDSRDNCNGIIETASNMLIAGCQNTVIPNTVTTIGSNAFKGCSTLTRLTIPSSVTTIGNYAFYQCLYMTDIYSFATTPPTIEGSAAFSSYTATLHVPEEAVEAYAAANYWKYFTIVGDAGQSVLPGDANSDGVVNVTDVTLVISYVLGGENTPINTTNADMNGDGAVNITDITILINTVLNAQN